MNTGYVRVSSEEQGRSGLSMEGQVEKIKDYAKLKDIKTVQVFKDIGWSGKNLKRPGIGKILDLIRKHKATRLIIYKLDRLTRSVKDLGYLLELFDKYNVEFVSITESIDTSTAGGKLMMNVIGSVAQWEREVISERTRFALGVKRGRMERTGGIPYGYKLMPDGKHLSPIPEEQKILRKIKEMRNKKASTTNIAGALNTMGVRTKKGAKWHPSTINNIVKRMERG